MRRLAIRLLTVGGNVDIDVRFEDGATIGQLTELIGRWRGGSHPTRCDPSGLVVVADTVAARFVPPSAAIVDSGLQSGLAVRLADGEADIAAPVATLSILAGPDAPGAVELRHRTVRIGRGADSDVRLHDPLVSRRHARLHVGAAVEIVDDGSANGIVLGGRIVDRAVVGPTDRFVLGDTVVTVAPAPRHESSAEVDRTGGDIAVAFHRSPRVEPVHRVAELAAPEPPQPPAGQRFPLVSLLVPIVMAVAIFAATESVLAILFVGLSPLLVVGSWLDTRSADRRQIAQATAAFRTALGDLDGQLRYAMGTERAARCREHPSSADVLTAAEDRSPLLWCRRPEYDRFAAVRLGAGTCPSRTVVIQPPTGRAVPELVRELATVTCRYTDVTGVPVVADLRTCGNVGVAGPRPAVSAAVRGLLVQLTGLHSPAELVLASIGSGEDAWGWLAWLPHTRPERAPLVGRTRATNSAQAAELAAELEALIEERGRDVGAGGTDAPVALPLVVVAVDDDAPFDRARLVQIAERGPSFGVHLVWSASSPERLPAACRAFVDLSGRRAVAGLVGTGEAVHDLIPEQVGERAAERFACRLSPLVDSGIAAGGESELLRSVGLVDLIGRDVAIEPEVIVERWRESGSLPGARSSSLRALIGRAAGGPLHIDLLTDGPHALVGGTTGSGKSELLQTWVAALAATHSPARVTFLFVDYKGGAAFGECLALPHCVGLVTDLDGRLVGRALRSLDAELRRRERVLRDRNAKDLLELERQGDPDCPPRLVIVVDEFAALVADVPEFVDGVVGIAQRGRSLGLHLVLATQRPAGVVSDHIRANTDLRIALRMSDVADSIDVVGAPVAATFDRAAPGRAVVSTGPARLVVFQGAHVGGAALDPRPASLAVRSLRNGGDDGWCAPAAVTDAPATAGVSDLSRIVGCARQAAVDLGLAAPRRPWLAELGAVYELPASNADEFAIGIVDDPERQSQTTAVFRPDVDGNMAVFGTSGSGTSTALRTIAAAAASSSIAGAPVWVYGVDFGARGLQPIALLPNVGSVVQGDDHDRLVRLLRMLAAMVDERAERFADAGAATLGEYRRRSGRDDEARVVLLIDGIAAFRAEYEGTAEHRWWDALVELAARGRSVGVHVVVAGDRPASLSSALAAVVQQRLVLRLTSDVDLAVLGVPGGALPAGTPAGRGWLDGFEMQVAVPGGVADVAAQGRELAQLAEHLAAVAPGASAPVVGSLPAYITVRELPTAVGDGLPVIGVADDTLAPVGFVPAGTFVVAGPPRSGRTTAIVTIVRAVVDVRPGVEPVLLGRRRSPLFGVADWAGVGLGIADIEPMAHALAERVAATSTLRSLVVIESIADLLGTGAEAAVHDLVRACRDADALVVAEGEPGELAGSWPLLQAVKAGRAGIVLQPDQLDGEALFKTAFPRTRRGEYPPGRGLLVRDGRLDKVQVAVVGGEP